MRVDCSITENYFKEKVKMVKADGYGSCNIDCHVCPLSENNNGKDMVCTLLEHKYPETSIALVQRWSDEHQPITNLDYLLKHFPNTKLDEDGTPAEICPDSIGLPLADGMVCKGNAVDCKKCWSRLYEEK